MKMHFGAMPWVLLALATGSLAATACGQATSEAPEGPPGETLLFRRELAPGHTISFHDYGRGLLLIQESAPVERADRLFMKSVGPHRTLADVYRKLDPGAASLPSKILIADRNAETWRAQAPASSRPALSLPIPSAGPIHNTPPACSPDHRQDSWGGDWFFVNFCLGGPPGAQSSCLSNMGGAEGGGAHSWSVWYQMEGDYNVEGSIRGTVERCDPWGCGPQETIVHQTVPPRHVQWFEYYGSTDTVRWQALSPCRHGHTAFKWM
jgi:hypothetical protein